MQGWADQASRGSISGEHGKSRGCHELETNMGPRTTSRGPHATPSLRGNCSDLNATDGQWGGLPRMWLRHRSVSVCGAGSVSKATTVHACGPEYDPQDPCEELGVAATTGYASTGEIGGL